MTVSCPSYSHDSQDQEDSSLAHQLVNLFSGISIIQPALTHDWKLATGSLPVHWHEALRSALVDPPGLVHQQQPNSKLDELLKMHNGGANLHLGGLFLSPGRESLSSKNEVVRYRRRSEQICV